MSKNNLRDITKQWFLKTSGYYDQKNIKNRMNEIADIDDEYLDIGDSSAIMNIANSQLELEKIAIDCLVSNLIDEQMTLHDIIQICIDKHGISQEKATEGVMAAIQKALKDYQVKISN